MVASLGVMNKSDLCRTLLKSGAADGESNDDTLRDPPERFLLQARR